MANGYIPMKIDERFLFLHVSSGADFRSQVENLPSSVTFIAQHVAGGGCWFGTKTTFNNKTNSGSIYIGHTGIEFWKCVEGTWTTEVIT